MRDNRARGQYKYSYKVGIFDWLCSSLMCLLGSRSSSGSPDVPAAVDLVVAEGRLATSSEQ